MPEPSQSPIDDVIAANERYAASEHTFESVPARPRKRIAVVLCMDARIDPFSALGFRRGDAHIIRNAGGRLADAERSLLVSQQLLGTEAVLIIHHTDCGMMRPGDEDIRERIRRETGEDASAIEFLTFRSLEESLREDLGRYAASRLLRQDIPVRGFVFDVRTGLLTEVK